MTQKVSYPHLKAGCGRWHRVYDECGGVAGWKRSSVASLVLVEEM